MSAAVCLLAAAVACRTRAPDRAGADAKAGAPGARPDIVESLRADLRAPRHPSDGAGRAWIEKGPRSVVAGSSGSWTIVYEAGPRGIAVGGMLFLQVSPFWGWSTPQVEHEEEAGFTKVTTDAAGVSLAPSTLDQQLLGIRVEGRALAAGRHVHIEYGAGPEGAHADRFAERGSRFWVSVDGDGDGVRGLLPDSPAVDVVPGPPERLVVTAPSVVRPGETLPVHLAVLDAEGDAWPRVEGNVTLRAPAGVELPSRVRLAAADRGCRSVDARASREEVVRIEAEGPGSLHASSNPVVVSGALPRVYWGDLHGHSSLSDGTGTPEDYFRYARDIAALDVAALTDHDHWGMQPLATHPALWDEIRARVRAFYEPGRFVTLLGFEWTSWIHGHRHVLYFGDEGRVLDSVDPAFDTPQKLWNALRGAPALTITHHTAGGPIGANWNIPPDPALEPVTEVASVHGSSEAPGEPPRVIYDAVEGNFARDALGRGYRLGFVGSGDGHDGHPGLAQLASGTGGLVAVLADEVTREGVLAALRARRVYATNGPRIVLHVTLDGAPMGSVVSPARSRTLQVLVVGAGALERVDVVRREGFRLYAGKGSTEMRLTERVADLTAGEYLYVRAVQEDGGAAWSSPFFVE